MKHNSPKKVPVMMSDLIDYIDKRFSTRMLICLEKALSKHSYEFWDKIDDLLDDRIAKARLKEKGKNISFDDVKKKLGI